MSLKLLYEADAVVSSWVQEKILYAKFNRTDKAIGFVKDGRIIAGVVFTNHVPEFGDVKFSFAMSEHGWQYRKGMAKVFEYAFNTLGCRRVTTYVRRGNKKPINLLTKHLNFTYEGCIREFFPDGKGALIYGLLRKDIPSWVSRYVSI